MIMYIQIIIYFSNLFQHTNNVHTLEYNYVYSYEYSNSLFTLKAKQ